LANLAIFKGDAADADGNEIGELLLLLLRWILRQSHLSSHSRALFFLYVIQLSE